MRGKSGKDATFSGQGICRERGGGPGGCKQVERHGPYRPMEGSRIAGGGKWGCDGLDAAGVPAETVETHQPISVQTRKIFPAQISPQEGSGRVNRRALLPGTK